MGDSVQAIMTPSTPAQRDDMKAIIERLERIAKKNKDEFRYRIDVELRRDGSLRFHFDATEKADGHTFVDGIAPTADEAAANAATGCPRIMGIQRMTTPAQRAAEKIECYVALIPWNKATVSKIAAIIESEYATDLKLLRVSKERMEALQLELAKLGVERRECVGVMKEAECLITPHTPFQSREEVLTNLRKLIGKMGDVVSRCC